MSKNELRSSGESRSYDFANGAGELLSYRANGAGELLSYRAPSAGEPLLKKV